MKTNEKKIISREQVIDLLIATRRQALNRISDRKRVDALIDKMRPSLTPDELTKLEAAISEDTDVDRREIIFGKIASTRRLEDRVVLQDKTGRQWIIDLKEPLPKGFRKGSAVLVAAVPVTSGTTTTCCEDGELLSKTRRKRVRK